MVTNVMQYIKQNRIKKKVAPSTTGNVGQAPLQDQKRMKNHETCREKGPLDAPPPPAQSGKR